MSAWLGRLLLLAGRAAGSAIPAHACFYLISALPSSPELSIPSLCSVSAAAAAAADFVVGLHQMPSQPSNWYILQGCSGSVYGGQVVGLLGPSGAKLACYWSRFKLLELCVWAAWWSACYAPRGVWKISALSLRQPWDALDRPSYASHAAPPPLPAGCGKTTLLGSIAGSAMDLGSSSQLTGTVEVDGHRWVGHITGLQGCAELACLAMVAQLHGNPAPAACWPSAQPHTPSGTGLLNPAGGGRARWPTCRRATSSSPRSPSRSACATQPCCACRPTPHRWTCRWAWVARSAFCGFLSLCFAPPGLVPPGKWRVCVSCAAGYQ